MLKTTSQKIEKWQKKDYAKVISLFVINTLVIMGIMLGITCLNCIGTETTFIEYLQDFKKPLHLFGLLVLIVIMLFLYLWATERNFLKYARNSEMGFLILEISLLIVFAFGKYVNIYLRPLALPVLLLLFLTNRKIAIYAGVEFTLTVVLMDAFATPIAMNGNYSALIIGIVSGLVASLLLNNVYSRLKLIALGAITSIPAIVCLILVFIQYGLDSIWASLICAACSGVLNVSLLIVLLPIFEFVFKRVSCFKLAELSDHKSRLIKKMIVEAPGTFNHSIVVSNIAEACAIAIDEDALLARTCAYYHDIGKIRRPEYFKENQADRFNPHDNLTPELSTNIIKSHAIDGYQLAIKNGLPKIVADICLQHHGTMPILYFYDKAKKFTDGQVDIASYSYAGPKPQTKIAAIIMIADGCEAVTRTLKNRSRENVLKAVRKLVNDRMSLGQFDECEITIKDLNIIIHTVVNNLTGVYHKRVEYPKVNLDGIATELLKEDDEAGLE